MQDVGTDSAVREKKERVLPVFPRKISYALRRCLGEVGKVRLHSWGSWL